MTKHGKVVLRKEVRSRCVIEAGDEAILNGIGVYKALEAECMIDNVDPMEGRWWQGWWRLGRCGRCGTRTNPLQQRRTCTSMCNGSTTYEIL
jgi:hypothetical protein